MAKLVLTFEIEDTGKIQYALHRDGGGFVVGGECSFASGFDTIEWHGSANVIFGKSAIAGFKLTMPFCPAWTDIGCDPATWLQKNKGAARAQLPEATQKASQKALDDFVKQHFPQDDNAPEPIIVDAGR